MNHNVHARLERVKTLWLELSKTPKTSARYTALVDEIRAAAGAYMAAADGAERSTTGASEDEQR